MAGGQTESIFRAITDAIGVSKMYLRYVNENAKAALELNLRQRIERSIYLSLDLCGGIKEKYIQGNKII